MLDLFGYVDRDGDGWRDLPDGPEHLVQLQEAKKLATAYMPDKVTMHRVTSYMAQPWLVGYRVPVAWSNWYHMVDIDGARRAAH